MRITKEEKQMHKFLDLISKMIAGYCGEDVIFAKDNILYFSAWSVAGSICIKQSEVNVYEDLKDGYYSLVKTPRGVYKLDLIKEQKLEDHIKIEMNAMRSRALASLKKDTFVCNITNEERHVLAKISNASKMFVNDSYLSLMNILKDFEVNKNDDFIICEHIEVIEKEQLHITTLLSFYCEKKEEYEFNQEKIAVD